MRPLGYPGVVGPVWFNTENHIVEPLIEILHQNLKLEDLSDQDHHGNYVFHWQGIDNARKKYLVISISLP